MLDLGNYSGNGKYMARVLVSDAEWGSMMDDAIAQAGAMARELGRHPGHGVVTIEFNRTMEFVDVNPSYSHMAYYFTSRCID